MLVLSNSFKVVKLEKVEINSKFFIMAIKNPIEQRSIRYAIKVQNLLFVTIAASILSLIGVFNLFDPYAWQTSIWLMWILLWVFGSAMLIYAQFWYYFSYMSQIIYVHKVNSMIYRGMVFSSLIIYTLVLAQTEQLNYASLLTVLLLTVFYFFFSRS